MTTTSFPAAERVEIADPASWVEFAYERGWTDGLPVAPPTPEKVAELVRASGRAATESVGPIPPRYGEATIEKLAINAVMAGCLPEYFPIVVTAVEAMLDPAFNLAGVQVTTHMCEPLIIISGPIVDEIGVNTGHSVFGSGRPNATIGRAVSLVLWNIGGTRPGDPDKTTFSHPGRWSFCIGERRDENPWPSLHTERGLSPEQSAVTVFACEAPHSLLTWGSADRILQCMADGIAYAGSNNSFTMGELLFVIPPEPASLLAEEGLTRDDIRRAVWERSRMPLGRLKRAGWEEDYARSSYPPEIDMTNDDTLVPMTVRPEDMHIVVTGGAGRFTAVCPGWGSFGGLAITRPIPASAPVA